MYASKNADTKAIVKAYYDAIKKADAITDENKLAERYAAFADAEAILIEHAIAVPLGLSGGYQATKLNGFEGQYAPFGSSTLRYKGQHIMDAPMSTDMFNAEMEKWEAERAK